MFIFFEEYLQNRKFQRKFALALGNFSLGEHDCLMV